MLTIAYALGMDCSAPRKESAYVAVPHNRIPIPRWMGLYVYCSHVPLDIFAVAILQHHGIGVGAPRAGDVIFGDSVPCELWQRLASIPCVSLASEVDPDN